MRQFLKTLVLASIITLGGLFITNHGNTAGALNTQTNCSDVYAIMCNGASSHRNFMTKVSNDFGRGGDLQSIYAEYGLKRADYDNFVNNAQTGTIRKDGTITVNGKVVGKSTQNLGRTRGNGFSQSVNINGESYWGGSFDDTYHADTAEVLVLMKNGKLVFAAIASCGNPQRIVPVEPSTPEPQPQPTYACNNLQQRRVQGVKNRYSFTTSASAAGGARVVRAVYDFGDGNTQTVRDLANPVEHTFKQSSKVTVVVYVSLPNGGTKAVRSAACETQVTVSRTEPPEEPQQPQANAFCSEFKTPVLINEDQRLYRFTVVANTTNARFVRADFRFSDNQSDVMPAMPNNGNQVTISHAFPADGTYNVTATLHFEGANNRQFSANCAGSVTINGQAPPAPDVCSADAEGKDCAEEELTKSGVGTVVAGIFGGASSLAAAGHYVIRRRLFGL